MVIHSVNIISHPGISEHLTQVSSYPTITRNMMVLTTDNHSTEFTIQATISVNPNSTIFNVTRNKDMM